VGKNRDGNDEDVLFSWRVVEACVEAGRYHGVAHVGESSQLEDARAGRTGLRRGSEAGQDLPALEDGRAVLGPERGYIEERRGHEGMGVGWGGHLCTRALLSSNGFELLGRAT
jgi:hypothetical protein